MQAGRILLDVTTVDPLQSTVVQDAALTPLFAAARRAQAKRQFYQDPFPGDTFIPLAIEIFGALGDDFDRFVSKCARQAAIKLYSGGPASDRPYNKVVVGYRQRLSIALQRAQATTLLQRSAEAVALTTHYARAHPPLSYSVVASASRYVGEQ